MEKVLRTILNCTAGALLLMGFTLGFVPAYTAESGGFGDDSVSCGSPFMVSDDLTDFGQGACESEGLSARRAWAIALIVGGVAFAVGAVRLANELDVKGPPDPSEPRDPKRNYPPDWPEPSPEDSTVTPT